MPKLYLIHPAVGCARMGNSNDGVQIAPEVPYGPSIGSLLDLPAISGRPDLIPILRRDSFRGLDNKIRRQGVRFRIFEYDFEPSLESAVVAWVFENSRSRKAERRFLKTHDNSLTLPPGHAAPREVTLSEYDIEWTVTLANKKVIDWTLAGTPDAKGHISESDINFRYNDNLTKKTVTLADIAREGTPVRELMEPGRLKLGDMVAESTGQMILIGSAGATIAPQITGPLASPRLENLLNRNWQDDAADGPVTARIRPKGSNEWIDIGDQGDDHWNGNAWAIVGPPHFGGDVTPIVSLHDVALSLAVGGNRYLHNVMEYTSYSRDIYPILRGIDMATQVYVSAYKKDAAGNIIPGYDLRNTHHAPGMPFFLDPDKAALDEASGGYTKKYKKLFLDALMSPDDIVEIDKSYPEYDFHSASSAPDSLGIFHEPIRTFNGTRTKVMPRLIGLSVTHLQYQYMKDWVDEDFKNDWGPGPSPNPFSPLNIDLASMRAICGGAFLPGIEVGRNVWNRDLWSVVIFYGYEPLVRLNSKDLKPGDLTKTLGNPWQYDYKDCDDDWWPASRPISLQVDAPTLPGVPAPPVQHYRWHREVPVWSVPNDDDPLLHIWKELGYIKKLDGSWQVKEEERIELTPNDNKPYPAP